VLDERGSGRLREYSYPWLIRDPTGQFHVFYTWNRVRIKHVSFNESWLDGARADAGKPRRGFHGDERHMTAGWLSWTVGLLPIVVLDLALGRAGLSRPVRASVAAVVFAALLVPVGRAVGGGVAAQRDR
jgi:hypothetical protein